MADDDKEMGAAYVPWTTFRKSLEDLAKEGLPNQIDRSVWKGQSWGTQSQLIAAFKFLGLTDDKGKPSNSLTAMTGPSADEDVRKEFLKIIFSEKYADLFALDLTKATSEQLDKAMGSYRVSGETREKAVRFFLSGLLYLGIPVSKHLQPTKAANGSAPRRGRKPGKKTKVEAPPPAPATQAPAGGTAKSITLKRGETLTLAATADFFAMDPSDRKFVFELIEKLEGYEQQNPTPPAGKSQAVEKGGEGDEVGPTVKA